MGEISRKVQESRLKWSVHVMKREEEYVGKRVMVMDVLGGKGKEDRRRDGSTARLDREDNRAKRLGCTEETISNHRPHIKVGKDVK